MLGVGMAGVCPLAASKLSLIEPVRLRMIFHHRNARWDLTADLSSTFSSTSLLLPPSHTPRNRTQDRVGESGGQSRYSLSISKEKVVIREA